MPRSAIQPAKIIVNSSSGNGVFPSLSATWWSIRSRTSRWRADRKSFNSILAPDLSTCCAQALTAYFRDIVMRCRPLLFDHALPALLLFRPLRDHASFGTAVEQRIHFIGPGNDLIPELRRN